jgi:hypothetical protein
MEETRRQETLQNRLHSCEACFRNSIRDVRTLPGADIDNLLVAEVQTTLKAIKKAGKRKPK